jgi:hypothetical protein
MGFHERGTWHFHGIISGRRRWWEKRGVRESYTIWTLTEIILYFGRGWDGTGWDEMDAHSSTLLRFWMMTLQEKCM